MRKVFMLTIILMASLQMNAQTWSEWFRQKKTQKRYLLQQIAALKVYIDYAQKGYQIVNKGLVTIRNIKNGDFNIHQEFFNSLKTVNPVIKQYGRVGDIISFQVEVIKESRQVLNNIRDGGQFTPDELDYCKNVFDNLLMECLNSIDELFLVITSGQLEMKDDERMKRIDKLYGDMQNKYAFCSDFGNEMGMLSVHRLGEQMEIGRSKLINGLP